MVHSSQDSVGYFPLLAVFLREVGPARRTSLVKPPCKSFAVLGAAAHAQARSIYLLPDPDLFAGVPIPTDSTTHSLLSLQLARIEV